MRALKPWLPLLALALVPAFARDAEADDATQDTSDALDGNLKGYLINRKHTVAELEAGILALPNKPIKGNRGGNVPFGTIGKGDATVQTGAHLLFRGARDWTIGALALFCPRPTSDNEPSNASGLQRTHARSYLQLAMEARYIPLHFRTFEFWVGGTFGGVVVADRYVTNARDPFTNASNDVPAILGTKEVTIRNEGIAFGIEAGGDWMIAERLVAGLTLRLDEWLLPIDARCSPIGDCTTLTGPVTAFEIGLKLGYRVPL